MKKISKTIVGILLMGLCASSAIASDCIKIFKAGELLSATISLDSANVVIDLEESNAKDFATIVEQAQAYIGTHGFILDDELSDFHTLVNGEIGEAGVHIDELAIKMVAANDDLSLCSENEEIKNSENTIVIKLMQN